MLGIIVWLVQLWTTSGCVVQTINYNCISNNISILLPLKTNMTFWRADYSQNPFLEIPTGSFDDVLVQGFNFAYNMFTVIRHHAFTNLSITSSIYISRSVLTLIETDAFANLPLLNEFYLIGNLPSTPSCFPWPLMFQTRQIPLYVSISNQFSTSLRIEFTYAAACASEIPLQSATSESFLSLWAVIGLVASIIALVFYIVARKPTLVQLPALPSLPTPGTMDRVENTNKDQNAYLHVHLDGPPGTVYDNFTNGQHEPQLDDGYGCVPNSDEVANMSNTTTSHYAQVLPIYDMAMSRIPVLES